MPETQAKLFWTPPTGTLGGIVAEAAKRVEVLRRDEGAWRERALAVAEGRNGRPQAPSFRMALSGPTVAIIAEVKRRSPSKGAIRPAMDAASQARAYAAGGAAAVSVLTEPRHFGGSDEDLEAVTAAVSIPALKKDFHVHPVQLYQARALGASAALLIARAVAPEQLGDMVELAREIGLETLVEVRTEGELVVALEHGADIIGVNNRDLETLIIDPSAAERVVPRIPARCVAVAESGMTSRTDVERASAFGADAALIGSAISAAEDPEVAVTRLAGVPVRRDGRAR